MSFHYKGVCYPSPESTLAAMAADMTGVANGNGGPVSYSTVVDGPSLKTITSAGFQTVITPQLQPCQLIDVPQAILINLAIGAVWAVAYGYKMMTKAVDAGSES